MLSITPKKAFLLINLNRNMNMNGRMFQDEDSPWSPEFEDQENILRTVEGIIFAKLLTNVQCSTFYKEYFERDFYV